MSRLVLGLPSKGRLQDAAIDWFAEHGVTIARAGAGREYAASASGINGLEVVMLSAGEIPRELSTGRIHLGVTGEDLVREQLPEHPEQVRSLARMGFGHADLVVAVPAFWVDVETMADLEEAAARFRVRHGHAMRIATKYHNLTRAFFRHKGVADYRIVDSQGATEAGPKNQSCEALVDITSSGETLRANHLKILDDGLILRSQATLFAGDVQSWPQPRNRVFRRMCETIGVSVT